MVVGWPKPFFLEGSAGRVFAVHHEVSRDIPCRGHVLVVPGFNEEMNRCRSMVTLQAQSFASLGVGTFVVDLFGTGESDGVHGDARWDIWVDDLRRAIGFLEGCTGGCVGILGIRLGFALALDALSTGESKRQMLGWQPVPDGKNYFLQFMRMKIAANMDRTDIPKDTTSAMRKQLADGQSIEIAGYEIAPALAGAIEAVSLASTDVKRAGPIAWFEKRVSEDMAVSPASLKTIEAWKDLGIDVALSTFDGPAFWALHDRFLAPDLIQATSQTLARFLDGQ